MEPVIIGIAGGSASGKTTLASEIGEAFPSEVVILKHDNYYKAHDELPLEERRKLNFDHPDAYATEELIADLVRLKRGEPIDHPVYSYIEHTRLPERKHMESAHVIIVEGILIFENDDLVKLMDIKVYVETDDDLRFIRRALRDVKERGRDLDSVIEQYVNLTKPMHHRFVEPSKRKADVIIPNNGEFNRVAVSMLIDKIGSILNRGRMVL